MWRKKRRRPPGLGTQGYMHHPSLAWLACLALACLAILASYRPRSPCLHQQRQQRCFAPPRRRRQLGCCCEVQARRARPIRGEVSQARQGRGAFHGFLCCLLIWALGPLFGLWPGASTVIFYPWPLYMPIYPVWDDLPIYPVRDKRAVAEPFLTAERRAGRWEGLAPSKHSPSRAQGQ